MGWIPLVGLVVPYRSIGLFVLGVKLALLVVAAVPVVLPAGCFTSLAGYSEPVPKRRTRATPVSRVFLLSPANCGGTRAKMVMSEKAQFALAQQLRSAEGASLGDVFAFMSGLYFRGKLAYARRFARPPDPVDPVSAGGVLVITPNAGLRAADMLVTVEVLQSFAGVSIDLRNASYRQPLQQGARALLDAVGPDCEVVLLGSIASGKYVELLEPIFGERLMFPPAFVGRGDMSRGGLMLRCVTAGLELDYTPIIGAVRHGERPPRLEPLRPSGPSGTRRG